MIGEWLFAVSHRCDVKIHREEELPLSPRLERTTNRWWRKLVGGARLWGMEWGGLKLFGEALAKDYLWSHVYFCWHISSYILDYSPNVSVFLFQMADLELYFSVNGYSVITCWSPNEDHLLIYIVLSSGHRSASPNVMGSLCHFLILSLFPLTYSLSLISPGLIFFLSFSLPFSLIFSLLPVPQKLGDELITFCITGPSCHAGSE